MADQPDIGRRIRAAIEFAGLSGFAELAERIGEQGLGERTLRKLADPADRRTAKYGELITIARATQLPVEFFTAADKELISALQGGSGRASRVPTSKLEPRLRSVERAIQELRTRNDALDASLISLRMELAQTALARAAQADESSAQRTGDPHGEDHGQGSAEGPRR